PEKGWDELPIKNCFGPYATLLVARGRLQKKIVNLDAMTTDSETPRKRKKPAKLSQFEVNSSQKKTKSLGSKVKSIEKSLLEYPTQPHVVAQNNDSVHVEDGCSDTELSLHLPLKSATQKNSTPISSRRSTQSIPISGQNACHEDLFEANVLSSLSVIKLRLQPIEETQELILEQLKTSKGSSLKSTLNLPVVSLAALESSEETLMSQEDVYNELVIFILELYFLV
ncbi:unnamed protein product, partial [Allacma fusca]